MGLTTSTSHGDFASPMYVLVHLTETPRGRRCPLQSRRAPKCTLQMSRAGGAEKNRPVFCLYAVVGFLLRHRDGLCNSERICLT